MLSEQIINEIQKVSKDFDILVFQGKLAIRFGYWQRIKIEDYAHINGLHLELEHVEWNDDCGDLFAYIVDVYYSY